MPRISRDFMKRVTVTAVRAGGTTAVNGAKIAYDGRMWLRSNGSGAPDTSGQAILSLYEGIYAISVTLGNKSTERTLKVEDSDPVQLLIPINE